MWKETKLEKDGAGLFLVSQPPLSGHVSGLTHSANPPAEISDLPGSIYIMKRTFLTDGLNSPDCTLNLFPIVLSHLREKKTQKPGNTTRTGQTILWPSVFHFHISVWISIFTFFKFLSESQIWLGGGEGREGSIRLIRFTGKSRLPNLAVKREWEQRANVIIEGSVEMLPFSDTILSISWAEQLPFLSLFYLRRTKTF